jgi:hypothetical protein
MNFIYLTLRANCEFQANLFPFFLLWTTHTVVFPKLGQGTIAIRMHQHLGHISQQYSRQHFKKRQEQWIYCMLDLTVHTKIKETQTLIVELLSSRVEKR